MKKFYLVILLLNIQLFAQIQNYDFGTGTGTWTTGASTTFLPTATSGTARVAIIGTQGGQFDLSNSAIAGGTASELIGAAATGTPGNKFSIYSITNPSPMFSLRFSMTLNGAATTGAWLLYIGDGVFYSNDLASDNLQNFCLVRWAFNSTGGGITSNVFVGSFISANFVINKGDTHVFEIFANNSNAIVPYNYNASSEQLAANSYDLWLDGVRQQNDDVQGFFTPNTNITSFAFLGRSVPSNAAVIYLDDISYASTLENGPLPVELTSFTSTVIGNTVNLKWETATEVNNYGFEILRQAQDDKQWTNIGFVNGNGNSNSPKFYSFEDKDLRNSKYSYRLKQIDNDGQYEYSKVIEVDLGNPEEYSLLQNFPNPFNPVSTIGYSVPSAGFVSLKVFDVLGREVATLVNEKKDAGKYTVNFNGEGLGSGIYFYTLQTDNIIISRKMNLLK